MATAVPYHTEVETALVARLMGTPGEIAEVVSATLISGRDFYDAACRALFDAVTDAYYGDDAVDALTIGAKLSKTLGPVWGVAEDEAVRRVVSLSQRPPDGSPVDHARLVRRDAEYRGLLRLAEEIQTSVGQATAAPDEIAGVASERLLKATMHETAVSELVPFDDVGREFVRETRKAMAARAQGIELGAYYGLKAIDLTLRGHRGGELVIAGGEPGVGKSAVWWRAALSFCRRQGAKPKDQQVGALIVSLEMSPEPSNARFASMISGASGQSIREGTLPESELQRIITAWRRDKDIPLYVNYAPTLRASQLRALIHESIRRHNVGVVVIDHFRMFDLDKRLPNRNDEDEEKVRFLKEQIAMAYNVAVVCLAHTRKPDPGSNGRPKMSDLRGSYQVAAHSDYVGFVYRPAMYATEQQIKEGNVNGNAAVMVWAKTRHASPGEAHFHFDGSTMMVCDP
jgi:replicative DNA helicase